MSHLISHLLTALVMLLIAKTVRQFAEQRMNGREGRITLFARLLPIIPLGFFSTFAVLALQDPDPDDRLAGWFVLVGAVLLFGVLLYYWTYRLVLNEEWLLAQSLIGQDRMIHFSLPFDLIVAADQKQFSVKQNGKTVKVSWIVSGYPEFLARLIQQKIISEEQPLFHRQPASQG